MSEYDRDSARAVAEDAIRRVLEGTDLRDALGPRGREERIPEAPMHELIAVTRANGKKLDTIIELLRQQQAAPGVA